MQSIQYRRRAINFDERENEETWQDDERRAQEIHENLDEFPFEKQENFPWKTQDNFSRKLGNISPRNSKEKKPFKIHKNVCWELKSSFPGNLKEFFLRTSYSEVTHKKRFFVNISLRTEDLLAIAVSDRKITERREKNDTKQTEKRRMRKKQRKGRKNKEV